MKKDSEVVVRTWEVLASSTTLQYNVTFTIFKITCGLKRIPTESLSLSRIVFGLFGKLFQADDACNLRMMTWFWTAVVVYICGPTVYGTAGEDEPTVSLASAVTPTIIPTVIPTEDESIKLVDWLTKYGYLPPPDPSTGQLQAWTAVTQAVKKMQRFAGLDDTGVLDEETIQLIQTPRCSLPDDENQTVQISAQHSDVQSERIKRAVSTWARRNINWRLRSYPASSKLSREVIRSLVYYALRVWADPTLLEIHEVRGPEGADLQIDFWNGPHGDGYPFDGAGGSVGHAFFPSDPDRAGGVHLDAEEEWTFRQPATEGTDLFTVLVHELGHALGLSHSSARQSVMRPYYQGPLGDPLHFSLGHHDLQHITALYGERGNHIPTDRPPLVTEPQLRNRHSGVHRLTHVYRHAHGHFDRSSVDRCNTSFDAVAKIRGEIFFFKDQNMWRVSRGGLVSIRAAPVQRLWSALPSSLPPLRAVLERHTDHAIIFISGSEVWLFKDLSLQEGFPKPLIALTAEDSEGGWQGLHWDPAQGVVWGSVKERRGKESEIWRELIEGGVNGIITENYDERDEDGHYKGSTYVFKGNSYWKFTHPGSSPIEGYPRPLATDWLDCPQPSSHSPGDISLISHSFGRQELREQNGQRIIDQIRHKDETERDKPHHWDCPCLNTAVTSTGDTMLLLSVLFVLKSPLSFY